MDRFGARLSRSLGLLTSVADDGAFKLNAVGQAEFHANGEWTEDSLQEAVDACPMSAIRIIEPGT